MAPSGSGEGVILDPSPTRISASKRWFFTWNNYNGSEDCEKLKNIFINIKSKFLFQEETGENGTKHLQGCVSFEKKQRPFECVKIKEIHWEKCKDWTSAIKYCSKVETRTGSMFYNIPIPRVDTRFINANLLPWQDTIEVMHNCEPDDRTINWFTDIKGGKGKTFLAKYLLTKYSDICYISSCKSADILTLVEDHYKTYIIDIPRSSEGFCPFNAIEQLKNGLVTDGKLKKLAKITNFAPPHVFIFSNFNPDMNKLSQDRWKIVQL